MKPIETEHTGVTVLAYGSVLQSLQRGAEYIKAIYLFPKKHVNKSYNYPRWGTRIFPDSTTIEIFIG